MALYHIVHKIVSQPHKNERSDVDNKTPKYTETVVGELQRIFPKDSLSKEPVRAAIEKYAAVITTVYRNELKNEHKIHRNAEGKETLMQSLPIEKLSSRDALFSQAADLKSQHNNYLGHIWFLLWRLEIPEELINEQIANNVETPDNDEDLFPVSGLPAPAYQHPKDITRTGERDVIQIAEKAEKD